MSSLKVDGMSEYVHLFDVFVRPPSSAVLSFDVVTSLAESLRAIKDNMNAQYLASFLFKHINDEPLVQSIAKTACAFKFSFPSLSEKIVACLLATFACFSDEPLPTPIRAMADTSLPGKSVPTTNVTKRDEQREVFLSGKFSEHVKRLEQIFGKEVELNLRIIASIFSDSSVVRRVNNKAMVIGDKDIVYHKSGGIAIEDCTDATIFVTACVPFITVRRCKRCTFSFVPASVVVILENCSQSVISSAAPHISLRNVVNIHAFLWSKTPISMFGDVRDIVVGPYNVSAPGLISSTTFSSWMKSGQCDYTDFSSSSVCRSMTKDEFYWRFLPVENNSDSQTQERLSCPVISEFIQAQESLRKEPLVDSAGNIQDPSSLDINTAKAAEMWAQASFVTWLLEDNKAASLKNALR